MPNKNKRSDGKTKKKKKQRDNKVWHNRYRPTGCLGFPNNHTHTHTHSAIVREHNTTSIIIVICVQPVILNASIMYSFVWMCECVRCVSQWLWPPGMGVSRLYSKSNRHRPADSTATSHSLLLLLCVCVSSDYHNNNSNNNTRVQYQALITRVCYHQRDGYYFLK